MTTSETGRIRASSHKCPAYRAGFTLLEIILVVALIALASSVIISNFTTFLKFENRLNPEEVLYAAIRSARFHAACERELTSLSYEKESASLVLSTGDSFPLNYNFSPEERGEIRFYLVPSARGMERFSDPEDTKLEVREILFASDRSSNPFIAVIDNGQGAVKRLVFDPFSNLVRRPE